MLPPRRRVGIDILRTIGGLEESTRASEQTGLQGQIKVGTEWGGKADHTRVGEAEAAMYLVFLCARHGVGHGIMHENVHCNLIIAFTNSGVLKKKKSRSGEFHLPEFTMRIVRKQRTALLRA